jgi:hypothetical protein
MAATAAAAIRGAATAAEPTWGGAAPGGAPHLGGGGHQGGGGHHSGGRGSHGGYGDRGGYGGGGLVAGLALGSILGTYEGRPYYCRGHRHWSPYYGRYVGGRC